MKKPKKAFTLVELVVVMIIIVILSLISFLYSKNSTINARNANRTMDIGTLQSSLELYHTNNGKYILPDDSIDLFYIDSDHTFAYQGTFGPLTKIAFQYKNIKTDPLDKVAYTYSVSEDEENYQIISFLEKNKKDKILSSSTSAALILSNREVKLYGNPVGIFVNKTTLEPANFSSSVTSINVNTDANFGLYLNDEKNMLAPGTPEFKAVIPNTSCKRLKQLGHQKSGNYDIITDITTGATTKIYCDMKNGNGGWTAVWQGKNVDYNDANLGYNITPEKINATQMMIGYINNAGKLLNYYYFDIPNLLKTTNPLQLGSTTLNLSKVIEGKTGQEFTDSVKLIFDNIPGGTIKITGTGITDAPNFTGFSSNGTDNCGTVEPIAKECGNRQFIILAK